MKQLCRHPLHDVVGFFYHNRDVFGRTVDYFTDVDTASLSLVNQELYRMTKYAKEKRVCPQLYRFLQSLLKEKSRSEAQKDELQHISLGVQRRIGCLSKGSDAVPIAEDGDYVERTARAIAVVLSKDMSTAPIPQNTGLVREVCEAASAYEMLSGYLDGDFCLPVVKKFRSLPAHYVQHMLDLSHAGRHTGRCIRLLYDIHRMLCERGDMNVARPICRQACHLVANRPHGKFGTTTLLYNMLVAHRKIPDAMDNPENNHDRGSRNVLPRNPWYPHRRNDFDDFRIVGDVIRQIVPGRGIQVMEILSKLWG